MQAAAASIGRRMSEAEAQACLDAFDTVAEHPDVVASKLKQDVSAELNREALLIWGRLAGLDEALLEAIWQRDGCLEASFPYPDTADVLHELRRRALKIAIVSDIHFELQPHFAAHGLDGCVDAYVLSYKLGYQKPDPRMFQTALDALGLKPEEALMVGDNPRRDTGAEALGITTLILAPVPDFQPRGLDDVLRLLD
jgi:putative hydrolase of the HAD superfamily